MGTKVFSVTSTTESLPTESHFQTQAVHSGSARSQLSRRDAWLSVVSFSLTLGPVIGLGYTCFAPIAGNVATKLGQPALTSWCLNAWTLASCVSFLTFGYVGDLCGRRPLLLSGSCIGILGFVICASARNVATLIAGQVILGISTALLFTVYSAAAEIIEIERRSVAVGLIDCGFILPWASLSVIISNYFLTKSTWRCIFYIGIILETIGLLGVSMFYRPKQSGDSKIVLMERLRQFDIGGLLLFTGGLTGILIGLMWGGTPSHPWVSVSTICPIVVGTLSILVAVAWDARFSHLPVLPCRLTRDFRAFGAVTLVIFFTSITFFPMLAFLPQGLFVLFTHRPAQVGILSLPTTVGQGIVILLGTVFVRRLGSLKTQLITVIGIQMIFQFAAIGSCQPSRKWEYVFIPAVSMSMYGWAAILNISLLSINLPKDVLGTAIALNSSARTAGGALGIAIYNTILDGIYRHQVGISAGAILSETMVSKILRSDIISACLSRDFSELAELTSTEPLLQSELMRVVQMSFGHGLEILLVISGSLCLISLLITFFIIQKVSTSENEEKAKFVVQQV